ncbi:MAG TPA: NADH-quinone oxidoreductase subunit H [Thermoplasmatales archaeon]|nr:NADH-quinone oxidoreductase subunit H [Thermoplasmatales archaeon]
MNIEGFVLTLTKATLGTAAIALFGIIAGLVYKGIDRKLSAHMQARVGPPIRQPFWDVIKLFVKENIVPEHAISWLFNLAPIVALSASIVILLYLPIGGFEPLLSTEGDLILVLYLLIIPSLAMVIGGFASGSPYATVGAQREMVLMMSYEFPLAIAIIAVVWRLAGGIDAPVFSLSTITSYPIWNNVGIIGIIGCIILLVALLLVTPGELSKIPFDAPEAETEIAGGLLVEYSGRNLGMFYLADAVKTIAMSTLLVAIFFPYSISPLLNVSGYLGSVIDFIFYLIKIFLVILVSVTLVRVGVARLKIDQIVATYWVSITLLALIGLVLVMFDRFYMLGGM